MAQQREGPIGPTYQKVALKSNDGHNEKLRWMQIWIRNHTQSGPKILSYLFFNYNFESC